jgi:hypothetical protein
MTSAEIVVAGAMDWARAYLLLVYRLRSQVTDAIAG